MDVVVTNSGTNNCSVLLGDGKGNFSSAKTASVGPLAQRPVVVAVGDFNGDNAPDLAIGTTDGKYPADTRVAILFGVGDGTFQGANTYSNGGADAFYLATADLNKDGRSDVAVDNGGSVNIFLAKGDGTLLGPTGVPAGVAVHGLVATDVNLDTKIDLIGVNYSTNGAFPVLLGDGMGGLTAAANPATFSYPQEIAVGDFNGDGLPDVFLSARSISTQVSLYLNTSK
jgi:hypothetical protein